MSISEAISQLSEEKGISQDLIRKIIEEFLIAAYAHKFGTDENAIIRFNDTDNEPTLYAKKQIVETPVNPALEIPLQEALQYDADSEIGDELLLEVDPKEFDRIAIQSAKQRAKQCLSDIQKDVLFSEYGDKVGKMVVGYIQRERNGNIYISLGSIEGMIPKKFQSPIEEYRTGDRIKAIICEVNKTNTGLQIVLSRTHTDFVRRIFELEVPEIQDHTIEIYNIVREPGFRTKLSVFTHRSDVDPVGACVGVKGARIQAIKKEMEGERIDIINYNEDVCEYIINALLPAKVDHVQILNEEKKSALAIVNNDQLSLAIGKHGLNVRLANRIIGWNIDVKTREQAMKMSLTSDSMKTVSQIFNKTADPENEEQEITHVSELPDITPALVLKLQDSRIEHIDDLVSLSKDERAHLRGLTTEDSDLLERIIAENLEVIDSEQDTES